MKSPPSSAPRTPTVLIASGASGGHLFPALATAEQLRTRGVTCLFVLGGNKFADLVTSRGFPLEKLPASAFNGRGVLGRLLAVWRMILAIRQAMRLMLTHRPALVFASGGYATVASMMAAKAMGIPTMIQEQNVLPGRANRLLARFVDHVILTFDESREFFTFGCHTQVQTLGTPLRAEMETAAAKARKKEKKLTEKSFHILVTGGSQGSRIWNETLPETFAMLEGKERATLTVTHQALAADVPTLRKRYKALGLKEVTVEPFFGDMPARYAAADLTFARSGTSTMLEAAALGVPAIYVPHQLADGHQKLNAMVAERAGAAVVMEEPMFTPANVLVQLRALWHNPERRHAMREAALAMVQPGAAERVAAAVMDAVKDDVMEGGGNA